MLSLRRISSVISVCKFCCRWILKCFRSVSQSAILKLSLLPKLVFAIILLHERVSWYRQHTWNVPVQFGPNNVLCDEFPLWFLFVNFSAAGFSSVSALSLNLQSWNFLCCRILCLQFLLHDRFNATGSTHGTFLCSLGRATCYTTKFLCDFCL